MEIIFDENQNDAFQGQNYPVFNLRTPEAVDFRQLQKQARDLAKANRDNETVLIRPEHENPSCFLFAALLSLEGRNALPLQGVFNVADYKQALEKYRPYFSFTVAADYVLRLIEMDKNAMYKDIQSLSYLGLDVKNDYIENTITLHLSNPGRKYVFHASSLENTVILASFIKMLSLMKISVNLDVTIVLKMLPADNVIAINRDELLQKLFWCARPFLLGATRANG